MQLERVTPVAQRCAIVLRRPVQEAKFAQGLGLSSPVTSPTIKTQRLFTCATCFCVLSRIGKVPGLAHVSHGQPAGVSEGLGQFHQRRDVISLLGSPSLAIQYSLPRQKQIEAAGQVIGYVSTMRGQSAAVQVRGMVVGEQVFGLAGGLGQVCNRLDIAGLFVMVSHFFRHGLRSSPMERQQRPGCPAVQGMPLDSAESLVDHPPEIIVVEIQWLLGKSLCPFLKECPHQ